MLEQSLFILKPDALSRGLEEEIFKRVARNGLCVVRKKQIQMTPDLASKLYKVHQGKPFYEGLIQFVTSGPAVVSIIEGEGAISKLRDIMGATDPREAEAGTIRGDLREENVLTPKKTIKNLVHGSDSKESFEYESAVFFKEESK